MAEVLMWGRCEATCHRVHTTAHNGLYSAVRVSQSTGQQPPNTTRLYRFCTPIYASLASSGETLFGEQSVALIPINRVSIGWWAVVSGGEHWAALRRLPVPHQCHCWPRATPDGCVPNMQTLNLCCFPLSFYWCPKQTFMHWHNGIIAGLVWSVFGQSQIINRLLAIYGHSTLLMRC